MTSRKIHISDSEDENTTRKEGAPHEDLMESHHQTEGSHDETVEMLEKRVRELETENETLRDQRLRAIADLDNARRRADQDVLTAVRYASEDVLKKLLPVVDDFIRSVESGAETKDFNSFYEGVAMIRNKLMKLLEDEQVKRIEAVGTPFDVEFHEAMLRQPSDQPEDTVIAELEPGYMYKDKVLRHAKVIVSAGE